MRTSDDVSRSALNEIVRTSDDAADWLLTSMVNVAVPLWIDALRSLSWPQRRVLAHECAQIVAEKGDIILYKSKKKGETATAFNALAKGIALLAFAPGGVKCFGSHFIVRKPKRTPVLE